MSCFVDYHGYVPFLLSSGLFIFLLFAVLLRLVVAVIWGSLV